ncbi:hypothetical protein EMCRGX_G012634 [Ephydatia muelleri]|eukprot:Em0004g203a
MEKQTALVPPVTWAQRNDILFVTINLNDINHEKYTLDAKKLTFSGVAGADKKFYSIELDFLKEVVPEQSKNKKMDRGLLFIIKKQATGYWSRLLATAQKPHFLSVDFNRWKDEDESASDEDHFDDGGLNSMMQQMGGLGGMGGMSGLGGTSAPSKPGVDDLNEESDSDDEEMPGLEK